MKKTILFLSLLIIGAITMFGFQKSSNNTSLLENNSITETQQSSSDIHTYEMNVSKKSLSLYKCGAGKCGDGKAKKVAKKGKCGAGKCGGDSKVSKNKNILDNDSDGDGKVSRAEFNAFGESEFPKKDKNKDGKITRDECPMFDTFNTDGNKFLSKAEYDKGHAKMFSKMDKNNDGFIDANEAKATSKCGAGKCGEGKCGAGKCGGDNKKTKSKSKCGAGKCGG